MLAWFPKMTFHSDQQDEDLVTGLGDIGEMTTFAPRKTCGKTREGL